MADIEFKCPHCGRSLQIDEAHRGKRTSCPSCKRDIVVPSKVAEAAPQPKVVASSAASAEGVFPQEERDVLSVRPAWRAYLGTLFLAVLLAAAGIVAVILLDADPTVEWILGLAGLGLGLVVFLVVAVKRYSILYRLSSQRLFVVRGFIARKIEELELFRVRDIQVSQSVWQRILGFGRMSVFSTDATSPKFEIAGVLHPLKLKDTIRVHFRNARMRERVRPTEFISDFESDDFAAKDPSL